MGVHKNYRHSEPLYGGLHLTHQQPGGQCTRQQVREKDQQADEEIPGRSSSGDFSVFIRVLQG